MSPESATAPRLSEVVSQLRAILPDLRARGVSALWVFGSVSRGDARAGSDIAVDFAADAEPSLLDLVHLKSDLEDALGNPVDLGERSMLRPGVAERARDEMKRVF